MDKGGFITLGPNGAVPETHPFTHSTSLWRLYSAPYTVSLINFFHLLTAASHKVFRSECLFCNLSTRFHWPTSNSYTFHFTIHAFIHGPICSPVLETCPYHLNYFPAPLQLYHLFLAGYCENISAPLCTIQRAKSNKLTAVEFVCSMLAVVNTITSLLGCVALTTVFAASELGITVA